ncbi:bis(5'-nucleosyl)-tetraphosphatase (symmetrical) YqeK [Capillibacterium thermochitinicola]|nr:bis(5'-nucleosyl)-tetraphosphatase (symmetrical) YqeK [Capillibacterium thermochitinicola]
MGVYMNLETLSRKLSQTLSPPRFQHSLRVMNFARELARHYQIPEEPVAVAALMHDVAREKDGPEMLALASSYQIPILPLDKKAPVLLHGQVGAELLKREWAITAEPVLEAVAYHVTGAPKLGIVGELTIIADFAEPARQFFAAQVARELAFRNRLAALKYIYTQKIRYILDAGFLLHPLTLEARNMLLLNESGEE